MKTSRYFDHTRSRSDRQQIRNQWILAAIRDPVEVTVQTDGRIRKWTWVQEKGRFLHAVLLEDGETVHNAFFDRSYPAKEKQ